MKMTFFETMAYRGIKAIFDVIALVPPKTGEMIALFFFKNLVCGGPAAP